MAEVRRRGENSTYAQHPPLPRPPPPRRGIRPREEVHAARRRATEREVHSDSVTVTGDRINDVTNTCPVITVYMRNLQYRLGKSAGSKGGNA